MKSPTRLTAKFLLIFSIFLSSCGPVAAETATGQIAQSTAGQTNSNAVEATATRRPTPAPTATVWPPVFDLYALEDIRALDSFVVKVDLKNTVNGDLTEQIFTIGYIKEPFSGYEILEFTHGVAKTYVVDGRTYADNGSGDWYLYGYPKNSFLFQVDIPTGNTSQLVDAQFAGLEEYEGIPAYHFVLEPTTSTTDNDTTLVLEGDFYVTQTGNYVLYSHWKQTSKQGDFNQIYEVTEALSSINQLTEITLSGVFLEMQTALNLPVELKLPLPPDTNLYEMIRYKGALGIDYYTLTTPKISKDEFLDFYRNLAPTDGWTVTHIGKVSVHENDCEFSGDCVIIKNGSTQVVLYYNGAYIRAEFDYRHIYSPLSD